MPDTMGNATGKMLKAKQTQPCFMKLIGKAKDTSQGISLII